MITDNTEFKKDVFAWFGVAAYAVQCFEVELCILILLAHRLKDPSLLSEHLEKIDIKLSKSTLGALLSELKSHLIINIDLQKILNNYREKRNYLIHQFFFNHSTDLLSKDGCLKMIEELKEIHASLMEANKVAETMSCNIRKKLSISEKEIQELVKSYIEAFTAE
jgi:hypothetical protein